VTPLSPTVSSDHRHPTPTPGWESGVWFRIQRRRRSRRLALLALGVLAIGLGILAFRRPAPAPATAVRISATLDRPLRADGSAPLGSVWRIRFEGKELRVYRNALGVVHRCPGSPGCTPSERGGALDLPLATAGQYRALVFSRPGAGDGQTMLGDLQAATAHATGVEISPPIVAY
jgi:hypothetical protein